MAEPLALVAAPDYAHSSRRPVAAPPAIAMRAMRSVTLAETRLAGALLTLRSVPALLAGGRRRLPAHRRLAELLLAAPGFVELAGGEETLAFGYVGRPWTPSGGGRQLGAAEFAAFDAPGYAKVVCAVRAAPTSSGSVLCEQTRIRLTDARARRRFRPYWMAVRPGSALVRRSWLAAAQRRAERNR